MLVNKYSHFDPIEFEEIIWGKEETNKKRTRKVGSLPELLAPAGDMQCLYAAVEAGADAVYIGGTIFGARAYAKNFSMEEIRQAVNYCHLHGVKLYVAVNTLIYDREIDQLICYVRELYRIGVDALIVADLGAVRVIREILPDFELHASTQMSVHNTLGAKMARELGCSRVVPARELSLQNIKKIVEDSSVEVEVFLHGALCVCHSGQCLFSSLVGGRSGNRGECAQPCRLPYNDGYPLSLKDLSLAEHITELIDSGVASLKIEGRMKNAAYVYTVTSVYRRLLDERRNAGREELDLLARVFSRGGFTDSYFVGTPERNMTGIRSEEDKERSRELDAYTPTVKKKRVSAEVEIRLGAPAKIRLYSDKKSVECFGDIPMPAERSPLTVDGVKERLSKMGNTFLSLSREDISLVLDEGVNLSPASINALRREAARLLESCERDLPREGEIMEVSRWKRGNLQTAEFMRENAFAAAYKRHPEKFSHFDAIFLPLFSSDTLLTAAENIGVYLPPVILDSELPTVRARLSQLQAMGVKRVKVSNIGQILLMREFSFSAYGDFRLNITNAYARDVCERLGVFAPLLSPELTLPQARDAVGGIIAYGRIPLMVTERCFIKENFGCSSCTRSAFTDRRGEKFPIIREFEHRNIILNSQITYICDKPHELKANRIQHTHLLFTTEGEGQILMMLDAIKEKTPIPVLNTRRIGKRE